MGDPPRYIFDSTARGQETFDDEADSQDGSSMGESGGHPLAVLTRVIVGCRVRRVEYGLASDSLVRKIRRADE